MVVLKRTGFVKNKGWQLQQMTCLTAETVQRAALTFQRIDYVHGCNGLPLGVLGVCDSVTDYVFKEHLEYTTGLLVDQTGDTLDTASASQTTDSGLGDTLDVVTKNFAMTLSATLSQTLASFTATRHVECEMLVLGETNQIGMISECERARIYNLVGCTACD